MHRQLANSRVSRNLRVLHRAIPYLAAIAATVTHLTVVNHLRPMGISLDVESLIVFGAYSVASLIASFIQHVVHRASLRESESVLITYLRDRGLLRRRELIRLCRSPALRGEVFLALAGLEKRGLVTHSPAGYALTSLAHSVEAA
ncbi:MAG: hypothetical protein AAGD14_01830 [Planctomycetota bacterium]